MSAQQQDAMIAAASAIEVALRALAKAEQDYRAAYRIVARAAHQEGSEKNRWLTLDLTVGVGRLDGLIVQRLRALGLQGVLDHARADGTVTAAWIDELAEKIKAFI